MARPALSHNDATSEVPERCMPPMTKTGANTGGDIGRDFSLIASARQQPRERTKS